MQSYRRLQRNRWWGGEGDLSCGEAARRSRNEQGNRLSGKGAEDRWEARGTLCSHGSDCSSVRVRAQAVSLFSQRTSMSGLTTRLFHVAYRKAMIGYGREWRGSAPHMQNEALMRQLAAPVDVGRGPLIDSDPRREHRWHEYRTPRALLANIQFYHDSCNTKSTRHSYIALYGTIIRATQKQHKISEPQWT